MLQNHTKHGLTNQYQEMNQYLSIYFYQLLNNKLTEEYDLSILFFNF